MEEEVWRSGGGGRGYALACQPWLRALVSSIGLPSSTRFKPGILPTILRPSGRSVPSMKSAGSLSLNLRRTTWMMAGMMWVESVRVLSCSAEQ